MRRNSRRKTNLNKKNKINLQKIFLILFIFILLILIIFITKNYYLNGNNIILSKNELLNNYINQTINSENNIINSINNNSLSQSSVEDDNLPITFNLAAIGDTLCHNTQYWDAYDSNTNQYDFSYVYEDIKYYTKTADITIGSLETTFAGAERGYSNYPTFNTPDSLATALKKIGVDVISLAGNHALDYGYTGLCRTIDVFDNADISHLGTYKTGEDRDKILVKNVKGVNIAFINYTYGTNGIPLPSGKEYCVNLIDKDLIKKDILEAKQLNVDMIVACMHWGTEYRTTANDEQKNLANFLFENGVDIILGNHPHVLEPMEKRTITLEDGTIKDVFVVYALGNFTADQRDEITRDSAILNLNITKNPDGKISINTVQYTPIYMYKNSNASRHKFKILDIEKTILNYESGIDTSISASTYNNLKVQLSKIKSILGEEIK